MNSISDPLEASANLAYNRGVLLQQSGRLAEAIEAWREAVALDPHHGPALYNLAVALTLHDDEEGAEAVYEKLLMIEPKHREALYNLANLRKRQNKADEAEQLYVQLIEAHHNFVAGYVNLAKVYSDQSRNNDAELWLRQALAIEPDHAVAHWNLAHVLLRQGRWHEAWREYEWRLKLTDWLQTPINAPAWSGERTSKRLLLWNDQGAGDALQFLRYVTHVADRGHQVWVLVQEGLKKIALSVPGISGVVGPSDPMPFVDAQAPLLSMPFRLEMPHPHSSWREPYIKSSVSMDIPRRAGHRAIGLVWAGNQRHKNDAHRSINLKDLIPLLKTPDVDWFSLQLGQAAAAIHKNNLSQTIYDLSSTLSDYQDTAEAIMALDLVISVDTSVAHLAGALGRPCWLLLSAAVDWRWHGVDESNVWYPSLRLFRQKKLGDWQDVVDRLILALKERSV